MKQNKNKILNLRITESEYEAVHRLAKHYKRPIADLLRSYINKEDLKLLHNEQSQESLFEKSEAQTILEMNRQLMANFSLLTLAGAKTNKIAKKPVATLTKPVAMGSKGSKSNKVAGLSKAVIKRNKGIKQNE
jgi:hypothetical protein